MQHSSSQAALGVPHEAEAAVREGKQNVFAVALLDGAFREMSPELFESNMDARLRFKLSLSSPISSQARQEALAAVNGRGFAELMESVTREVFGFVILEVLRVLLRYQYPADQQE